MLVYFSGDWDFHWAYGILTHGHLPKLKVLKIAGPHKTPRLWKEVVERRQQQPLQLALSMKEPFRVLGACCTVCSLQTVSVF